MLKHLTILLPVLLGACQASAQPVSGHYGPLLIAVTDGQVAGVFVDAAGGNGAGDAPQFLCAALLSGSIAGEGAAIEVAIIEERAEWVRVEYVGGKRPISGWLRRSDLAVAG